MRVRPRVLLTAVSFACVAAWTPALAVADMSPTLEARALLPADATWPAPFPGIPNAPEPVDAPGSVQPVGGFSALVDGGHGTWLAMPDNGFGSKANSRTFLLRVYRVRPRFEPDATGTVKILEAITLRDPDHRIPFAIVRDGTPDRLLTGGDLDIESVRMDRRGTLWFGDEFGPFLLNTDATGKVLRAPIPLPDVTSPDYPSDYPAPFAGPANLASSNGFEGMALTKDGRTLLPALEGPVAGDDPHLRRMYEFYLRHMRYTPVRRTYAVDDPAYLVSDLSALDEDHLVALERDNFQGIQARHKRGFVVSLDGDGAPGTPLPKREVVDLLSLADPRGISLPGRPGDIGLGNPFSMPYVTIEAVLPLGGSRLAIVNDTNFGSTGRNPALPDYSDFIVVKVPGLRKGWFAAVRLPPGTVRALGCDVSRDRHGCS
jgi:hypothetical protein